MRRFLRFRAVSVGSSTCSIEGGRTIGRFHIRGTAKRRGGNLPARLRFSAHRGVTLIELMISMLILTLVCVAWLEIIGIQSARKEARRREAVERLAGMMDAFMYDSLLTRQPGGVVKVNQMNGQRTFQAGDYRIDQSAGLLSAVKLQSETIQPLYETDISPIGYRLRVVDMMALDYCNAFGSNWRNSKGKKSSWLVGELYDHHGKKESNWRPFFSLPACLGQ